MRYLKRSIRRYVPRRLSLGFPHTVLAKLRYAASGTFTLTAGNLAIAVFRANGPYDPDQSGIGHQPMYFDQYAAMYSYMVVYGCSISMTFVPYTAYGNPYNVFCGIRLYHNATLINYNNPQSLIEQGNFRYRIMNTSSTSKNSTAYVKHYYSLKKYFKQSYPDAIDFGSTVSSNPDSEHDAFFHVIVGSIDGTSFDQVVLGHAKLTYYIKFFNRVDQSGS